MSNNEPKKHHYIPQFHLRNFAPSGNLHTYDRVNKKYFLQTPYNAGSINNFHTIKDRITNKKDQCSIETSFNKVEAPASLIIKKILSLTNINENEKRTMSLFLDLQLRRTPKVKDQFMPSLEKKISDYIEKASQEEAFHKILKERMQGQYSYGKVEEYRNEVASGNHSMHTDEYKKTIMLQAIFGGSGIVTEAFFKMNWCYLLSPTDAYFITSDNPILFDEGRGIGNPEANFIIPLNSSIALGGSYSSQNQCKKITSQVLKKINKRIIQSSYKYVYAPKKSDWVFTILNKAR